MEKDKAVEKSVHAEEDDDAKKVAHLLECFLALTNGNRVCDVRKAVILLLSQINEAYPLEGLKKLNIKMENKIDEHLLSAIELLFSHEENGNILNVLSTFLFKTYKSSLDNIFTIGEFVGEIEDTIRHIDENYKIHIEKEANDE